MHHSQALAGRKLWWDGWGAGGTQHYSRVTGWSPSTFLTFTLTHTLSQAKDLHPEQGYPACLEET